MTARIKHGSQVAEQLASEYMNTKFTPLMGVTSELGRREVCGCCGKVVTSITYPHIAEHGYNK